MAERIEGVGDGAAAKRPSRVRKLIISACVAIVAVAVAGSAFWIWHEQPSFCGAICHTPMDPYLETYEQGYGSEGVDKWGNLVEDTSSMLVVSHALCADESGEKIACLSCHVPTMSEQVSEGIAWASGDYRYPLAEATLFDLTAARGTDAEEFCMNGACHEQSHRDLVFSTAGMAKNPHSFEVGEEHFGTAFDCGSCHKAHRASVNACTECHSDALADTPASWLTYQEACLLAS